MVDLSKIYIFRITHIDNIPHVIKYGITHVSSGNNNKNYNSIGDSNLINNRNTYLLGNGKLLGSYIPFYFWGRMPMLYVIQKGFNMVKATKGEDIVYCMLNVAEVKALKLPFIFTNGHAVDGFTEIFNEGQVEKIDTIVDFKAVKEKYWKNDQDLDLKRRKEAEFLIESDIPTSAIQRYIVYDNKVKDKLIAFGIRDEKVMVNKDFYF